MALSKMAPQAARLHAPPPWHSLTLQLTGDTGRLGRRWAAGEWLGSGVWDSQSGMAPCMVGWMEWGWVPPCPAHHARLAPHSPHRDTAAACCLAWQALSSPPGKGTGDARSRCPVLDTRARGTSPLRQLIPPSLLPVAPSPFLPSRLASGAVL